MAVSILSSLSSSDWACESFDVTAWAFSWSSHRSGAADCSVRSEMRARSASGSVTEEIFWKVLRRDWISA